MQELIRLEKMITEKFFADHVHLTDEGSQEIAAAVSKFLVELVRPRGEAEN